MKSEVVGLIGEHLVPIIKQLREAESLREPEGVITPKEWAEYAKNLYKELRARHTKERFMIDATEYWGNILFAKMEMIALVWGLEGLNKVHNWLENSSENDKYNFVTKFESMADGLADWRA